MARTLVDSEPYPEKIYHYTTLEGFLGILGGKYPALHATQIRFLNDRTELSHGINVLKEQVTHRISSVNTSSQRDFLNLLEMILTEVSTNNGSHEFFVVSFTTERDLLSQWRGYGSASTPVALGFSLMDFIRTRTNAPETIGFSIVQCIYTAEDKIRICNDMLDMVLDQCLPEALELHGTFREMSIGSLARAMAMIPAMFKDESFSEEKEWRFIYPRDTRRDSLPILFKPRNPIALPYVEIRFEDGIPLKEVIVGPSKVDELTMESVQYYISHSSFREVPVTKSNIPYR